MFVGASMPARAVEQATDSPGPVQPMERRLSARSLGDFGGQLFVGSLKVGGPFPHFLLKAFAGDEQRLLVAPLPTRRSRADENSREEKDRELRHIAEGEAEECSGVP